MIPLSADRRVAVEGRAGEVANHHRGPEVHRPRRPHGAGKPRATAAARSLTAGLGMEAAVTRHTEDRELAARSQVTKLMVIALTSGVPATRRASRGVAAGPLRRGVGHSSASGIPFHHCAVNESAERCGLIPDRIKAPRTAVSRAHGTRSLAWFVDCKESDSSKFGRDRFAHATDLSVVDAWPTCSSCP